jgi:putative endonuclease
VAACYTYILRCADGTLYTGWTKDLDARVRVHNDGTGAKYTRNRRPVELLRSWQFESRGEAMKFELKIKSMSRAEKMALLDEANATV